MKLIQNCKTKIKDFIGKIKLMPVNVYASRMTTTDLISKIVSFCELYSGITYYPYQEQYIKRIVRSVLENDGDEITALFSRQSGKSEAIAVAVGGLMIILPQLANMPMFAGDQRLEAFKNGFWVGIFAPSQRQASITYNRMRGRLNSKNGKVVLEDPDFRLHFSCSNGQTVALSNGSFATAISASEGSNIEGESFKFIICEECQDISNYKILKSIHPMGAAYNATIAKIGTATTFAGNFYEVIQRNKKKYDAGELRVKNHFEYNCDVVSKYNPKYKKYIEKEKERLGEDSDEFQMSYMLKWILQRGQFVDITEFEKRNLELSFGRSFFDSEKSHIMGIDVAGKIDSTVITIIEVDWDNPVICESQVNDDGEEETYTVYKTWIKDWLEILGDDYEEQYHTIVDYAKNFNIAKCVIDATKEASMAHRLRANMSFQVIPFVFSTPSKSEMYKHLNGEVRSGRARVPGDKDTQETREYKRFIEQLGSLQKTYSGVNMVVSHPPGKGNHDDYPDSWALAVFGAKDSLDTSNIESQEKKKVFTNINRSNSFYKGRNKITARRRR